MKKIYVLLSLLLVLFVVGCNKKEIQNSETDTQTETQSTIGDTEPVVDNQQHTENEDVSTVIKPLDSTIDINNLTNGTYSISLEDGAFYVDENGNMQVVVTIYDHDFYEASSIEGLTLNDTIQILNETITITSLEKTPLGNIILNGGFEVGGYDFTTEDGTLYFITGASDTKAYYEIGLATLPVATDFAFHDEMNNSMEPFSAEDFLADETEFYYAFSQYNTTIEIKDGYVISMTRIYTP